MHERLPRLPPDVQRVCTPKGRALTNTGSERQAIHLGAVVSFSS